MALGSTQRPLSSRTRSSRTTSLKDPGQEQNLEFFMSAGMGVRKGEVALPKGADFTIVISGGLCSPCTALKPFLRESTAGLEGVYASWANERITMLYRSDNEGMDFASHNVTLENLRISGKWNSYAYFIFLNSSVRGPFTPPYMPKGWQWPDAFLARIKDDVKLVSSSVTCLPDDDPGGAGPRAESWAYAMDLEALALLVEHGIFWKRTCKGCLDDTGIIVMSEYGMSRTILEKGYNIATLLSKYAVDTDWRDKANWNCNDNVHPSHHGTYDGISMHPYETVFVKESWSSGEPYLSRYTKWATAHSEGKAGTEGSFNKDLYQYALTQTNRNEELPNIFVPRNIT